jgi:DNA-binding GntR family transcriptional regulator
MLRRRVADPGAVEVLSRADLVEAELRPAILNGILAPGTRLLPNEIATQLGFRVSPTPLREALMRLAETGLVEIEPNRGASVARLTAAELGELYELRMMLEPWALERSVRAGDAAWKAELSAKFSALRSIGQAQGYAELDGAHRALHTAMLSRCDSQWLLSLVLTLADNSSRYRASAGRLLERRSGSRSAKIHKPMVDACLAGDPEMAATLCREHIAAMQESAKMALS